MIEELISVVLGDARAGSSAPLVRTELATLVMKTNVTRTAMQVAALMAGLALLVITTAASSPGLFHGDDFNHCCEFCHLGHVPILKPVPRVTCHAPPLQVSSLGIETAGAPDSFSAVPRAARSPPA